MIKAAKALTRKRTLFAVVLAITIFGAVYGFAATLGVGSNTLERRQRRRRVLSGDGHADRHVHDRVRLDHPGLQGRLGDRHRSRQRQLRQQGHLGHPDGLVRATPILGTIAGTVPVAAAT